DYATVAYEASTGARLWVARYTGPGSGPDAPTSIGVSPDGTEVFVTGSSLGSSSGYDYATVAYDAFTGAEHWVARYTARGRHGDLATSLGVSPDGAEVYVTGYSDGGSATGIDYATVAYSTG